MMRIHGSALLAALALTLAFPGVAQTGDGPGQRPAPTVRAAADRLFLEGRQLLQENDYKRACAKFKESHALDPAGGALLNLAACYERDGKTASAWRAYNEALAWANADHRDDRSEIAVEHIRELEPQLARFVLTLPGHTRMRDVTVVIDGEAVDAMYGTRVAVDPGLRLLEIVADGRETFQVEVTAIAGEEISVAIPPLRDAPDDKKSSAGGGSMSLGGDTAAEPNGASGPAPIRENPGACGCRMARPSTESRDGVVRFGALSAALALLLFRRRR